MAWRFCLPHQRALWYTHVNSGSLPCAPHCGDPLYHMLETPTLARVRTRKKAFWMVGGFVVGSINCAPLE